jgi:hypothetical protein
MKCREWILIRKRNVIRNELTHVVILFDQVKELPFQKTECHRMFVTLYFMLREKFHHHKSVFIPFLFLYLSLFFPLLSFVTSASFFALYFFFLCFSLFYLSFSYLHFILSAALLSSFRLPLFLYYCVRLFISLFNYVHICFQKYI